MATMLSAQCTDARVNSVTPELVAHFPAAAAAAAVEPEEVEPCVRSTGFFRDKAKSIVGAPLQLVEYHAGQVPASMEELPQLPGVARKTANVVLAHAFGINAGVTVDTLVKRLPRQLGLSRQTDPRRFEPDLMRLVPQPEWENLSIRLIFHGRAVCTARRPACGDCLIADLSPQSDQGVSSKRIPIYSR